MKKAIVVFSSEDAWEGLYVNGILVEENHTLNEGVERVKYFVELAKKYNFDLGELDFIAINENQEEWLSNYGSFPIELNELLDEWGEKFHGE
jgi:hypothetical protein